MNEIALSTDLKIIELEINHHKNIAGQSIWEIGRRLNHVKENDLAHGEFIKWVEGIGINHPEANRMMRVAKELPNSSTLTNLGSTALYLISTLPEEERNKEHVTEKGETKTPDEMTVKELQKLKKRLKQQSEIIENKNSVIAKQSEEIGKLRKQEPQVIEKEVVIEKIPDDYEFLQVNNQALETRLKESNAKLIDMAKRHKELLDQRKEVDEKSEKYDELTEAIQKAQGQLNNTQKIISDYKGVMQLLRESNDMVMKVSGLVYMDISDVVLTDNSASREFGNLLRRLTQLTNDLSKLTTKNIIEGEFTDE